MCSIVDHVQRVLMQQNVPRDTHAGRSIYDNKRGSVAYMWQRLLTQVYTLLGAAAAQLVNYSLRFYKLCSR
jgi:hypothetical protein